MRCERIGHASGGGGDVGVTRYSQHEQLIDRRLLVLEMNGQRHADRDRQVEIHEPLARRFIVRTCLPPHRGHRQDRRNRLAAFAEQELAVLQPVHRPRIRHQRQRVSRRLHPSGRGGKRGVASAGAVVRSRGAFSGRVASATNAMRAGSMCLPSAFQASAIACFNVPPLPIAGHTDCQYACPGLVLPVRERAWWWRRGAGRLDRFARADPSRSPQV